MAMDCAEFRRPALSGYIFVSVVALCVVGRSCRREQKYQIIITMCFTTCLPNDPTPSANWNRRNGSQPEWAGDS